MLEYGNIIQSKNTWRGTELHIVIPKKSLVQQIQQQQIQQIELRLDDNRTITNLQRKKAYATIRDISSYTGHAPEFLKEYFKYSLMSKTGIEHFSLSNCSITVAKEYINTLIEFCVEWGVILTNSIIERTDDIDRAIYYCLLHRVCIISGKPHADIHHCLGSRVGMGGNRNKIDNTGRLFLPLSRIWHTKVHQEGEKRIFQKFKIYGLELDQQTMKKLNLNYQEIERTEREVISLC